MNVSSNKSIIGHGSHSKLLGVSLNLSNSKNIIVSNFTIDDVNPHLVEAGDGLSVDNASHIWIDHLRTQNISDGHIDIRNSENITLSFNHFDGYNNFVCGSQHHYTMLLQDSQATLHNNYFDRVSGRNPKLVGDSTRAHLFNNYWQDVTYFAISASHGAQALIEKNVFNNSRRPHWNESGYIEAFGNEYTGISATDPERDGENEVFNDVQLYPYILENITEVNINVRQSAGPK
jgi:pectate lyase